MEEKKNEETRSIEITVQVEVPDELIQRIMNTIICDLPVPVPVDEDCESPFGTDAGCGPDDHRWHCYSIKLQDGTDLDWRPDEGCNVLLAGGTLLIDNHYKLDMAALLRGLQLWTRSVLLCGYLHGCGCLFEPDRSGKLTPVIRDGQYLLDNISEYGLYDIICDALLSDTERLQGWPQPRSRVKRTRKKPAKKRIPAEPPAEPVGPVDEADDQMDWWTETPL